MNTTTFAEVDGRTLITTLVECHTQEVRDAIIDSGMEGDMHEAMDKLEQSRDLAPLRRANATSRTR